ncbi:MAG: molybdenum cofactor biosynthesis protein MoaE [Polyangiaceae bacterium]|nr:molybdenum cofactor biosynthesis protein MoaE [Polyangiaceae bacterium]
MPRIRSERLSLDEVVNAVRHPSAGAIATFEGTVRNENEGRAVTLLEYEAYGPMAELEVTKILNELHAEMPGVRIAALHRIGSLSVGDAAVICAASAPHRTEAFVACRALIDRIKARLPIWKREHGPDGPYWVGWEDARCSPDEPHDHKAHTHESGSHSHEPGSHSHRDRGHHHK